MVLYVFCVIILFYAVNYKIMQFATSENQIVNKTKITDKIDISKGSHHKFQEQLILNIYLDLLYELFANLSIYLLNFQYLYQQSFSNYSYHHTIFDS